MTPVTTGLSLCQAPMTVYCMGFSSDRLRESAGARQRQRYGGMWICRTGHTGRGRRRARVRPAAESDVVVGFAAVADLDGQRGRLPVFVVDVDVQLGSAGRVRAGGPQP